MKTTIYLWAVIIASVLAVSADADPEIVTVSANGTGMYNSIQQAIDNVAPGTIIRIGAGIYEENLIINKPLKIQGFGWGHVTIMPKPIKANTTERLNKLLESKMRSAKTDAERKAVEAELKRKYFNPTVLIKDVKNARMKQAIAISKALRLEIVPIAIGRSCL